MKSKSHSIRKDRVAKARQRIAAGSYDASGVIDSILSNRLLDRVLKDFDRVPVGAGHEYRDLVAECLAASLSNVIDVPLTRTEFLAGGGRGDIDLPVRTEVLRDFPLWDHWTRRYAVRSVIVETKNEKNKASVEDVSQLEGYFGRTKLGRLGILVARMGFTANARQALKGMARDGTSLIIPLDHHGVKELARASKDGPAASMEYLRRQETLLLQCA